MILCQAVGQDNFLHRQIVHSLPCHCGNHEWQRKVTLWTAPVKSGRAQLPEAHVFTRDEGCTRGFLGSDAVALSSAMK